MRFVSVRDFRGKSAQIWKTIQKENDLVITSNGHPVALLSKVSEENLEESLLILRRARALQAVESMQQASVKTKLAALSSQEIDAEIKSVRRSRKR